jgi:DNA-binding CsgD family transcriptional regulator
LTADEIAGSLFIGARTVESHRRRILAKLSVRSIVEMHRLAARLGI